MSIIRAKYEYRVAVTKIAKQTIHIVCNNCTYSAVECLLNKHNKQHNTQYEYSTFLEYVLKEYVVLQQLTKQQNKQIEQTTSKIISMLLSIKSEYVQQNIVRSICSEYELE